MSPERSETARREPLSSVDVAWLRMDDPTNLMMINGVLVTDEPIAPKRFEAILENRLRPIPRFYQRVVMPASGGGPYWEPDPDFDLSHHLTCLTLPAPGDDAALREVLEELVSTPLDPARPLWHFHLIDNYQGGSVVMGRLHHCIGDGVGLMLVLLSLTDLSPDAEESEALQDNPFTGLLGHGQSIPEIRSLMERVMPDGMRLLLLPVEAFRSSNWFLTAAAAVGSLGRLVLRRPDPRTVFKGPLVVKKRVAWSEPIPLAEVRALGKALGGTVNDVLMTAMAGGLRYYLHRHGQESRKLNFRAAMPVNLRPLEKLADLGNQFGLVFLSLPVGIGDPAERLAELRRRALALKRSTEPLVVFAILRAMGSVPVRVQRWAVSLFATKATAVMTNVPGPREVLHLAGKPIRDVIFWVPQAGRVGIGISICSYAGRVRLGVVSDAGLVPDPEVIVEGFHRELEAMQRAAAASAAPPAGLDTDLSSSI